MSDQEMLVTAAEGEPRTLFDELAGLVPEARQAEYYRVIAHTRTLSPNDEMLRILEAMGVLALLTRETPTEIASERSLIQEILETSATQANASERRMEQYSARLESRLAQLPKELETGLDRLVLRGCSVKAFDSHFSVPVCQTPQRRLVSLVPN